MRITIAACLGAAFLCAASGLAALPPGPSLFPAASTQQTAVLRISHRGGSSSSPPASSSTLPAPQISAITSSGFTLTWSTSQALNSQVHYGIGNTSQTAADWVLATQHSVTVSGLAAGTAYSVQAESSYYSNPDLLGPVQSVTTLEAGATTPPAAPPVTPPATPPASGSRIFPNAAANWLYSAPTGTGINISAATSSLQFQINDHTQGFDFPVVYTDGSHGCTNFTDTLEYNYTDHYCVPNPAGGYFPSVGGWGADDGHLVVVNSTTGDYYDFWKLTVNSAGQPTSTNVGAVVHGNVSGNGTPGSTAANITGLAGDIMPGELDCATCLNHALSVIVPGSLNSNQVGTQAPASHTDGSVGGAIFREGAKIRFDPSINVASLNVSTATQAILRALQLYGGVITDQTGGSAISFYSSLATPPSVSGLSVAGQHLWIYY